MTTPYHKITIFCIGSLGAAYYYLVTETPMPGTMLLLASVDDNDFRERVPVSREPFMGVWRRIYICDQRFMLSRQSVSSIFDSLHITLD